MIRQTVPRQDGSRAAYEFFFSGSRNIEQDPDSGQLVYYFDRRGRGTGEENELGQQRSRRYDGQDHIIEAVDFRGNVSHFTYDGRHNQIKERNPLGQETQLTYDSQSRLVERKDPFNHLVRFGYDSKHHVLSTSTYPEPGQEVINKIDYFNTGQPSARYDGRGIFTRFTYDGYGNLQRSQINGEKPLLFAYDAIGRLGRLTSQENYATDFTYNKRNLLLTQKDPFGRTTTYSYNDDGTLHQRTDRQAESSIYSYTPSGKIASIRYHDNSTVRFSYNQHDRMTSMSDDLGTTSYIHDAAGRLISVTDPNGNTVGYVYDENGFTGLLTSLIYPGNKQVHYGYDQLNRLTTVTDWQGRIASYDYDAVGRLTQLVNFNGTVTKYFYDNADRLTGIDSRTAANAVIASFACTLDANGNRVEVEKQSPLQPLLPAISESSQHQQDRLSTRRNIQYTYDLEGQLATSKEGSAAAQVFSFNKAYRLTGISGGTTYSYDGSGNRLRAVRNGVETRYIYDAAGNLLAETDTAGAVSRYYIHGLGLLAAVTPADAVYCYHYDGVGSTVAITDSSQAVVNAYAYDPFGNILSQNEAFTQPFKYVGKLGVMAEPNGFYYMRARYYDPAAGRFISEDPLGFDGGDVNLYVYAGNNPVNRVDPEGLSWRSVALGSTSAALSTASLATMYYPAVSAPIRFAGTVVGGLAVANAVYEYRTGDISATELGVTAGIEAANFIGGFAAQPVEAFINGITRGVGIATTSIDTVRMMTSAPQPATLQTSTSTAFRGNSSK